MTTNDTIKSTHTIHFESNELGVKKALEHLSKGNENEAISSLLEVLLSKKTKSTSSSSSIYSVQSVEPIALKFVQLCSSSKTNNHKLAKDGLVHYRNIVQNQDPNSINLVFEEYMNSTQKEIETKLTNDKIEEARKCKDLEIAEHPSNYVFYAFNGSEEPTDSENYVSSLLKKQHECYRNIIDITKNNTRLQQIYKKAISNMCIFVVKFNRKQEFRKFIEVLKSHLNSIIIKNNLNKTDNSRNIFSIDLSDYESVLNLINIRFDLIETAFNLNLFGEASKCIEDVHHLSQLLQNLASSRTSMKNQTEIAQNHYQITTIYYNHLIKLLFETKEYYVFHCACYLKLLKFYLKNSNLEEAEKCTEKLLLAAIIITNDSNKNRYETSNNRYYYNDVSESKMNNLKQLCNLKTIPTKKSIMKKIGKLDIMSMTKNKSIKELFFFLEYKFDYLKIKKVVPNILNEINSKNDLKMYSQPIINRIWLKITECLSSIYSNVSFEFIEKAINFETSKSSKYTFEDYEHFVINNNFLIDKTTCKICHVSKSTKFVKNDIQYSLNKYNNYLSQAHSLNNALSKETIQQKTDSILEIRKKYLELINKEHAQNLETLEYIEEKKQIAEWFYSEKEKVRIQQATQRMQKENDIQKQKLMEQNKQREKIGLQKQFESIKKKEALNLANKIKHKVDINSTKDKEITTEMLKELEFKENLKSKEIIQNTIDEIIKNIDYLTRATRLSELKVLDEMKKKQIENDKKEFEENYFQNLNKSKELHNKNMETKNRFERIYIHINKIEKDLLDSKKAQLEKLKEEKIIEFNEKIKPNIIKEYRQLNNLKQEKLKKVEIERKQKELATKQIEKDRLEAAKANIPPPSTEQKAPVQKFRAKKTEAVAPTNTMNSSIATTSTDSKYRPPIASLPKASTWGNRSTEPTKPVSNVSTNTNKINETSRSSTISKNAESTTATKPNVWKPPKRESVVPPPSTNISNKYSSTIAPKNTTGERFVPGFKRATQPSTAEKDKDGFIKVNPQQRRN